MAKAQTRRRPAQPGSIESKVVDYAEELGRLIGTVRARVDGWGAERRALVAQLSGAVKTAQTLLSQLGQGEKKGSAKGRGTRTQRKSGKPPKHMAGSAESKTHRLPATTRSKMEQRGRGKGRNA
jgi:hypothetical protein